MPRAWVVPRDGGAPVELRPDRVGPGRIQWADSGPANSSASPLRDYRRTVLRPDNVYVYVDAEADVHTLAPWVTDEIRRQLDRGR
jgi:hypothetical protein